MISFGRSVPLAALLVLLVVAANGCARPDTRGAAAVGKPAPSYAAQDLKGQRVALAALKGKPVLLNVWATWCAPCREELPFLEALYKKHRPDGLELIGVSVDSDGEEEHVAEFARDFGITYPLWHDPDMRVMSTFLSLGAPATYLIDRDGILRWKHLGVLREDDKEFAAALKSVLSKG